MAYTKFNDPWEDSPSEDTPITAEALNHMEDGIQDAAATADSAVQPGDLAVVATTGDYDDLTNKPSSNGETNFVHVADYGAVADGAACWLLTTSAASTTISDSTTGQYLDIPFKASDAGKTIRISPADFSTATVTRTIVSVAPDGRSAVLSSAPGFTTTAAIADWGGTDNTTAIQAAIDAAAGRTILFDPGVYRVGGALSLRAGTRLEGVGWGWLNGKKATGTTQHQDIGTTIALARGVDAHLLSGVGTTDPVNSVSIKNMRLIGNTEPSTTNHCLNAVGGATYVNTQWDIANLDLIGGLNSLHYERMGVGYIADVNAGLSRQHAVNFVSCYDQSLRGVSALNIVSPGSGYDAVHIDSDCHGFMVTGGFFQFSRYGLYLSGDGHTVVGNRIDSAYDTFIFIENATNCVVSDNKLWMVSGGAGMSTGNKTGIDITGTTSGTSVVGNNMYDPNGLMEYGVRFRSTGSYNTVGPNGIGPCVTARFSNTATGSNHLVINSAGGGAVGTDTIFDAKGDLAVGTGSDTAQKLTVGTNNYVLTADSAQTTGLKWAQARQYRSVDYSVAGVLAAGTDVFRWYNKTGKTLTIDKVFFSLGTVGTVSTSSPISGKAVVVDVNKDGTTIFTTQANRPAVATSANLSSTTAPDVTTIADGSYLTFDLDFVGASGGAANMVITVEMSG